MADTLIQILQDKEYSELKDNIERVIAKKIVDRVEAKKAGVMAKLNGVAVENPTGDDTDPSGD